MERLWGMTAVTLTLCTLLSSIGMSSSSSFCGKSKKEQWNSGSVKYLSSFKNLFMHTKQGIDQWCLVATASAHWCWSQYLLLQSNERMNDYGNALCCVSETGNEFLSVLLTCVCQRGGSMCSVHEPHNQSQPPDPQRLWCVCKLKHPLHGSCCSHGERTPQVWLG